MARVKVQEIVDHLSSEMRRALSAAVREIEPEVEIDEHALFRAFRRAVGRKCALWESVPDHLVKSD
jgi:hypothetical protein